MICDKICQKVSIDKWMNKYPKMDREYIWYYPLFRTNNFDTLSIWKDSTVPILSKNAGIYFHIPVCKSKCHMCPFYFELTNEFNDLQSYVNAMIKELELYSKHSLSKELNISSIYFGGGTASLLDPKEIDILINEVKNLYDVNENVEITLECHPNYTDKLYLQSVFDSGINRVSFGIQSFDDKHLLTLGRKQNPKKSMNLIKYACEIGFKTVGADFIYRIPGQRIDDVLNDLRKAEDLGINSLSVYSLDPIENTKYFNKIPSEDIDRQMFYSINKYLIDKGWIQVAQPDYAKRGHENKEINISWAAPQGQIIGIGAGAWSNFNNVGYCNVHDIREYIKLIRNDFIPILSGQLYNLDDAMSRYLVLGVRCLNVPYEPFVKTFGIDFRDIYHDKIKHLKKIGLIVESESFLSVTHNGLIYVDNISKTFYSNSNRCRLQPIGSALKGLNQNSYTAFDEVLQ